MKEMRTSNRTNIKYIDALCKELIKLLKNDEYRELIFSIKISDGIIQSASIKPFAKNDTVRVTP